MYTPPPRIIVPYLKYIVSFAPSKATNHIVLH
jgi:hypothetical protein